MPDEGSGDLEGPPFSTAARALMGIAVGMVLAVALVLRFWARSDLWLDEALTVNIAAQPLHELPSYLRRDGAPPLFYLLLHFWMGWFGTSDLAVRSLSGVLGVATLPLAWLAGRRIGGRAGGCATLLLLASSPFAVRYDTETRMYALVVLLTVLGLISLERALRVPRVGTLVAVGAVTGLLLYTQYWSIYLIGATSAWLAWRAWRGSPPHRGGARWSLAAMAIGCLTFVPWLPIFLFQSHHTGTPWATPASFATMVGAVEAFTGGTDNAGRALNLIFFSLVALGLFGVAVDRHHIQLDIRGHPPGRAIGIVVGGTLAAATVGGILSNSTLQARYASVVFLLVVLLAAIGLTTVGDRRVRAALLATVVIAGLAESIPNVTANRTQAGEVAAAIAAHGRTGDVVAYCPDQLGPAVNRLLPRGRYLQTTFPRGTGPAFINWVDYATATRSASASMFADRLEAMATPGRQIFLVWTAGYRPFGSKCSDIAQTLRDGGGFTTTTPVVGNAAEFGQAMTVVEFAPVRRRALR